MTAPAHKAHKEPHGRYRIDLPAHMAECDANYVRLARLMPGLSARDERAFDVVVANLHLRVRMSVLERCPYTSLIELVECAADAGKAYAIPRPRLRVRLYHDAKTAEVVEFQNGRRFAAIYPYPNAEMRQPDEKAQINRFLGEYLSLCLIHGAAIEQPLLVASG